MPHGLSVRLGGRAHQEHILVLAVQISVVVTFHFGYGMPPNVRKALEGAQLRRFVFWTAIVIAPVGLCATFALRVLGR